MLLNLSDLISKYSLKIRGVIHVGAHHGEEVKTYQQHGIKNIVLIEPCSPAFKILNQQFGYIPGIQLFNCACASYTGEATMFTETANKGQSNSLLKPKNHLKHYPDIMFRGSELVQVRPLDALPIPGICNFLNMDTQGTECQVLVGGKNTLQHVDYVYTEVNKDDANLYEGACKITDLDILLSEFTRVETSFTNQGWGDAIYIRKTLL